MTNQIIIPVEQELMDYMESLHFEFSSYNYIMKNILLKNKISTEEGYGYNEQTYRAFMNDYTEVFTKYETAKKQILNTYVEEEEYKDIMFSFNFDKCCLESVVGECSHCE